MLSFVNCVKPVEISSGISVSCDEGLFSKLTLLNSKQYTLFPGFCDVHVHFREPGFSYKETIKTGSNAAAHGGYTAVCTMPNLNPVPDCTSNLFEQLKIIQNDASIDVFPYGSITVGELGNDISEFENLSDYVIAFSDDGKGIQDDSVMRSAMLRAAKLGKIIAAHCEDISLLNGGYIHDGQYATRHCHKGISSESEWKQIERDLKIADETKCSYHICHISTKESVQLVRDAKKSGVDVSCETAPHYLVLDDSSLEENGYFKMNPPLRSPEDRKALLCGIEDGTIDMIATDHAPHSEEEKNKGLRESLFGIVGLETAFSVLYTELVLSNIISIEKLVELLSVNPRIRFNIPISNDFSIWNLDDSYEVNPLDFLSCGKASPFIGKKVFGRCLLTVHNGKIAYIDTKWEE